MKSKFFFSAIAILLASHFTHAQTSNWHTNGNTASGSDFLGTLNNESLLFYTNGIETMRLKANGDLRINSLSGTGNNFIFSNSSGVLYTKPFSNDTDKFMTEAGVFRTASSFTGWKMVGNTIHSVSGTYVGIGVTNPQYILDVAGSVHFNGIVNATGINIVNKLQADTIKSASLVNVNNTLFLTGGMQNNMYTSSGDLRLQSTVASTGNTLMNLTNGNVGIGIFSPQYKFDVNGDARVSGKLHVYRVSPLPGDSIVRLGDSTFTFNQNSNVMSTISHAGLGMGIGYGLTKGYGSQSIAIGTNVKTFTNAPNSIVLGLGDPSSSNSFLLTNSTPNSLMIGFNSNIPTIFVSPAAGVNTTGAVCIGDTYIPSGFKLAVNGKIIAEEVNVKLRGNWPDFVFDSTYALMPMDSLQNFVSVNKHLPGIPSAAQMQTSDGVALGQLNSLYLQKIEELTLYMLQLQQQNEAMQKEIDDLKKK